VIRYKWPGSPGHETIDSALDKLLEEAWGKNPPK
jgi:hypothetical protein